MRPFRVALVQLLFPLVAVAQQPPPKTPYVISAGWGPGSAAVKCDSCGTARAAGTTGYVRFGGFVRPGMFLAIEGNRWARHQLGLDEIVTYHAGVVQWYPSVNSGLHVKTGLGRAQFKADDGANEVISRSIALSIGAGCDIKAGKDFSLTPFANYIISAKGDVRFNKNPTGVKRSTNLFQGGIGLTLPWAGL